MNSPASSLNREYAGETATVRSARRDVVDWLIECGADGETVERASLIASELASNAVQAAPGSPYQLRVRVVDPDVVSLSIRNHTDATFPPEQPTWRQLDQAATSGRGLSIVDSLSETVTVEVSGAEIIVTSLFRLVAAP